MCLEFGTKRFVSKANHGILRQRKKVKTLQGKDALSHFCNVTAIIKDVQAFCDNGKKKRQVKQYFVTEQLSFKMLKKDATSSSDLS